MGDPGVDEDLTVTSIPAPTLNFDVHIYLTTVDHAATAAAVRQ